MIQIDDKDKTLVFETSMDGLDPEKVNFQFIIEFEDVSLNFPTSMNNDGKLEVSIPAITRLRTKFDSDKAYEARLEAVIEEKYYRRTWNGEVKFEITPEINVKLENVSEKETVEPVKMVSDPVVLDAVVKEEIEKLDSDIKPKEEKIEESVTKPETKKYDKGSLLNQILNTK